jgi:CheY-like chemotaxis protein
MARKRALVVDDSKSARVILSRMLEKYDIEVDMAESAEQAIEYLKNNRPDAIFMDHLMPGMDGLQAVKAIKSNALTATIPIMMYTSQEGELYVGQARALGAMGVLPKQVRPVDVSKVLYELHLLPDRRDTAEPALVPVEIDGAAIPGSGAQARPSAILAAIGDARPPRWIGDAAWKPPSEQSADIRQFIVASLDSFASRVVSDVREIVSIPAKDPLPPVARRSARFPGPPRSLQSRRLRPRCGVFF